MKRFDCGEVTNAPPASREGTKRPTSDRPTELESETRSAGSGTLGSPKAEAHDQYT